VLGLGSRVRFRVQICVATTSSEHPKLGLGLALGFILRLGLRFETGLGSSVRVRV
jgi:hypothetical protein